jgi:hypothetical protein
MYKSSGSDQIPAELFKVEDETLWSEIHKLIKSVWKWKEFADQWKESITVQFTRLVIRTGRSNYHEIPPLPMANKIVFNITSRLSSYIDEIIGDHQCGF